MPRKKKITVLRLRQKLREVRLHPRQELVRFVHRLKGIFVSVFVGGHSTSSNAQASDTESASASASSLRSRIAPLPPPRVTPPGYQSIRCVTPSEHEEGLHDDPPPGIPYQQYFPYRSYEDLRAAQEHEAREELREARRRASSGLSRQPLMPEGY